MRPGTRFETFDLGRVETALTNKGGNRNKNNTVFGGVTSLQSYLLAKDSSARLKGHCLGGEVGPQFGYRSCTLEYLKLSNVAIVCKCRQSCEYTQLMAIRLSQGVKHEAHASLASFTL